MSEPLAMGPSQCGHADLQWETGSASVCTQWKNEMYVPLIMLQTSLQQGAPATQCSNVRVPQHFQTTFMLHNILITAAAR